MRRLLWPMLASAAILAGCSEAPAPGTSTAKKEAPAVKPASESAAPAAKESADAKSVVINVSGMS